MRGPQGRAGEVQDQCGNDRDLSLGPVLRAKKPGIGGPIAIERYLEADEKGRLIQSLKSFLASRLFTGTSVFGKQFSLEDLITIMLREIRIQSEPQMARLRGPSPSGARFAMPTRILKKTISSLSPVEASADEGRNRSYDLRVRAGGGRILL